MRFPATTPISFIIKVLMVTEVNTLATLLVGGR